MHKDRLEALAAAAEAAERDGKPATAAAHWRDALALLPPASQQHAAVGERVRAATVKADGASGSGGAPSHAGRWGALGAVVVFALSKAKLLLLGLTKLKTVLSMLAFLGVYWSTWGWAFGLGMVLSIYVHEMGHVAALRRLGIRADAPLFVPGVGALVMLREHPADARQDADIGLAGPTWGLAAALAALAAGYATGRPLLAAVAHAGAFLNLFNLIPVWQLDGARGFNALSRPQRWAAAGAIVLTWWLSGQRILFLLLAATLFQCFRPAPREAHAPTLVRYVVLLAALAALSARSVVG